MNATEYEKIDAQRGIDFIGVTCVFYCHDGKGNLLLHKRSNACRDEQGRWDVGGGAMEFGETFEDAVRREIGEEYGVEPISLRLVGVRNVLRKHNERDTHWIAVLFCAEVDRDEVHRGDPEKMDAIGWFSPDDLPAPVHSMLLNHLQDIRDSGNEFLQNTL